MALQVSGITVVDDSKNAVNVSSITFADASVQTSAGATAAALTTVSAAGTLLLTLSNPNAYSTSASDNFSIVVMEGDYIAVSAYTEDDLGGADSGRVYVFNSQGTLLYTLTNPNIYSTSASDYFGGNLAISSKYLAVSAIFEDDTSGTNSGVVYLFDLSTGSLVYTFRNPNTYSTSVDDYFGSTTDAIAIYDNIIAIGASYEDTATATDTGVVYVYSLTTGVLLRTISNPNANGGASSDTFGQSVRLSNSYILVSAINETDAGGTSSGKAYLFNKNTGSLIYTFDNPNAYSTSQSDTFGTRISVTDSYSAISAPTEDDSGGTSSGKVYIFNNSTGTLINTINNPNAYSTSASDSFGASLKLVGTTLYVGAPGEDESGGTGSGKVYVFNALTGTLLSTINNPNAYSTVAGDDFGRTLDVSGDYVCIGAPLEDDSGGTSSGKLYVFAANDIKTLNSNIQQINLSNGTTLDFVADKLFQVAHPASSLIRTFNNPNAYSTAADDQFGSAVAVSDRYVAVSAPQEDYVFSGGGAVYVFDAITGALIRTLFDPSPTSSPNFGNALSISNNLIAIASYARSSQSGLVYVFDIISGKLISTLDNPNAYSTATGDYFGVDISMSGNYILVGAYSEDDAGGDGSGKAYIFNIITGTLLWTLNNPNNYSTSAGDYFGWSVALSGSYALVTAQVEDDANGTSSGCVYIFDVLTGTLLRTLTNPNTYSTNTDDQFGRNIAVKGNYAIIGSPFEDEASGTNSGKAYIYNVTTGTLLWTLSNPNGYNTVTDDWFGFDVAISNNYAVVGAPWEDDTSGTSSGKAYIYDIQTGTLLYRLDNPNAYSTSASDYFGGRVAATDQYVIVSSGSEYGFEDDAGGSASGKAYLFSTSNQTYLDKIVTLGNSVY